MKQKIALLTSLFLIATAGFAAGPTPQEIIARHLEAIGGADALKNRETVTTKFALTMVQGEATGTFYASGPQNLRQEFEFQGTKITQATNGTKSWTINPFAGSQDAIEMPEVQRHAFENSAYFQDLFLDHANKRGIKLSYKGKVNEGEQTWHHLVVTYKNGAVQNRYYDHETGLLSRTVQKQPTPNGEVDVTTNFSDWREVKGMKYAFNISTSEGVTVKISEILVNETYEPGLFDWPAKS